MRGLLGSVAALLVIGGVAVFYVGVRPPSAQGRPQRRAQAPGALRRIVTGANLPARQRRRRQQVLTGSLLAGALVWLVTGWVVAVLVIPAVALGVPALLRPVSSATDLELLTGLESWTRGLSGGIGVGMGIETAIISSLSSTSGPLRPHVQALVARLRARWTTESALRLFADDVNDSTGDLVAGSLILGAELRGPGLSNVLKDLAGTVADEIRIRRGIEADRAGPRKEARAVTVITLLVLGVGSFTPSAAPYRSGVGQLVLLVLLAAYVATLLWMRQISAGTRTPRFLPSTTKEA